MTFTDAVQTCFRKYADFNGRATRSELWWWVLFLVLASAAAQVVSNALNALIGLATLLPSVAVTARRLHDIGRSGWWQLVSLIPLVGWLVVLYWCVQPSGGANEFDRA
jgi:uncharacterized membrane protein YhaH (DUF805 family)